MTAWGVGAPEELAPAAAAVWDAARGIAEAFQLTINETKSRVVAEPAPLRTALAAALPGAEVASEVKDLGVLQQLGRRPSAPCSLSGSLRRAPV